MRRLAFTRWNYFAMDTATCEKRGPRHGIAIGCEREQASFNGGLVQWVHGAAWAPERATLPNIAQA